MHKKEIKVTQKLRNKSFNKNFVSAFIIKLHLQKVPKTPNFLWIPIIWQHFLYFVFFTLSSYTLSLHLEIYIFVSELLTFKERVRFFFTHPVYLANCFVYKFSINVDHPRNKFFDIGNEFLYE